MVICKENRFQKILKIMICMAIVVVIWGCSPNRLHAEVKQVPFSAGKRIIGGVPAFPEWMSIILSADSTDPYFNFYCGASLINSQWLMTAAHCVTSESGVFDPEQNIDVIIGINDLTKDEGERIHVSEIIPNPDYDAVLTDGDIALLKLERPTTIEPLSIIAQSLNNPFITSGLTTALGWGATRTDGTGYSETLKQVALPVVTNVECQRAEDINGYGATITDNMMCAGYIEGGKDSCFGDSGSPLVTYGENGYSQVGIVSFGPWDGCAIPGAYGVYTRVSRYADWITQNICPDAMIPEGPAIEVQVTGDTVELSFDPVDGATGYQLYFADYPEAFPVYYQDMGADTRLRVTLDTDAAVYLLVRSYSGNCMGGFSNVALFEVTL